MIKLDYKLHNIIAGKKGGVDEIMETLDPRWLSNDVSKAFFLSARDNYNRGIKVKYSDIAKLIKEEGEEIGVTDDEVDFFMTQVKIYKGDPSEVLDYLEVAYEEWAVRNARIEVMNVLAKIEGEEDPIRMERVASDVEDIFDKYRKQNTVREYTMDQLSAEFLERQQLLKKNRSKHARMTGMPSFDKLVSDPGQGRFALLAGSTGHGKSSAITPIAATCLEDGEAFCIQSGEMSHLNSFQRLIQFKFGVSATLIESGGFIEILRDNPDMMAKYNKMVQTMEKSIIIPMDAPLSLVSVKATIRKYRRKGIKKFFFDRAELFEEFNDAQGSRGGDKIGALTRIGATLRTYAMIMDVDVFLVAQSNNEATKQNKGRTTIGTIYGGRSLTASADLAIGVYNAAKEGVQTFPKDHPFSGRPTSFTITSRGIKHKVNLVEIYVLKDTYGPGGSALVAFVTQTQSMYDVNLSHEISTAIPLEDELAAFRKHGDLKYSAAELSEAMEEGQAFGGFEIPGGEYTLGEPDDDDDAELNF